MSNAENPKIGFVSLGCPKALVDSERILTELKVSGYEVVPSFEEANLVIVNTCGFIDSAVQESLEAIGEAIEKNGKVIVTGCLGVKEAKIRECHPKVLEVTGPHQYESVLKAVQKHLPHAPDPFLDLIPTQGIKLTPRHYAYLKISEGCNHRCTFCIIPSLRGDLSSRPIDAVLKEATQLKNAGVRELLVISQDTSAYGLDLGYAEKTWGQKKIATRFYDLVEALGDLGIWIRLHYVYPYPHVDKVISLMAEGRVLPYLDIPFQHASPAVLKAMKRPASTQNNLERVRAWRERCPEIAIRSTFIVGFPGETEADFEMLLDFLIEAKIDRAGCFQYSPVEGAKANALPNPVPEAIKEERYHRFMECQAKISQALLKQKVGKTLDVLVDEVSDKKIVARSKSDAPEIDGQVILKAHPGIKPGMFLRAHITQADHYDLVGTVYE